MCSFIFLFFLRAWITVYFLNYWILELELCKLDWYVNDVVFLDFFVFLINLKKN